MNFNGLVLRDTREAFNLSRKELADKLNVTEQSIGLYETRNTTPSFVVLGGMTRLFGVSVGYFNQETTFPKIVSSQHVAYRATIKNSNKNTERETVYLSLVDNVVNEMIKNVRLLPPKLEILEDNIARLRDSGQSLDEIAHFVRQDLGVDDRNTNLMAKIEQSGVFILERSLNDNIDAYSVWSDTNRPYIVLGINKSGARRLFDLAHEFGHLLLHKQIEYPAENDRVHKQLEDEANAFASALLLDKELFQHHFRKVVLDATNPNAYKPLKEYYNVSIAALQLRAKSLGLLQDKQSGYFWAKMTKMGYKKIEPLDDAIPLYVPGKLYAVLGAMNQTQLRNMYSNLGINRAFIEKLMLRKLKTSTKENMHGSNIVSLPK